MKSTEMLRYGEWEAGPNLPKKLYGHSVIGFENDLYVLGHELLNIWTELLYLTFPHEADL